MLEIVTAILLGLVSVATAIGAYQAGQWGQESSDLAGASQQLRDRNLALFLESQNTSRDDGERFFDALALYAEMSFYPERTEALMAEQDVIMAAASPPLAEAFGRLAGRRLPARPGAADLARTTRRRPSRRPSRTTWPRSSRIARRRSSRSAPTG